MASPDVQSMDLNEVGAYTLLLCIAWQQDRHGYLPDDENKLRRWARMSPEQWAISREMLLGKFPVVEAGMRANIRMIREAEKQSEFSAKQSGNGKLGGRPKKALGFENKAVGLEAKPKQKPDAPEIKPSVSVSVSASVFASEVEEQPEKQKPSPPPVGERVKKPAKVPDPRHQEFREAFRKYFLHKNTSLSEEPWDGQEAGRLSAFLKKNPNFTVEQWKTLLNNRANSPVSHSDPLSAWVGRALNWASARTDKFGNQPGGSNGKPNRAADIADSTNATLALRRNRTVDAQPDSDGGGAHPVTTARSLFERPHAQLMAQNTGRDR